MEYKGYIGTKNPITEPLYEVDGCGIYFSTNKSVAETYNYGGGVYEFKITLDSPLVIDCNGHTWQDIPLSEEIDEYLQGAEPTTWKVVKFAKINGCDGVVFQNILDIGCANPGAFDGASSDTIVAFNGGKMVMVKE